MNRKYGSLDLIIIFFLSRFDPTIKHFVYVLFSRLQLIHLMVMRESIYTVSGTKSIIHPAILIKHHLLLWFCIHFHCLTLTFSIMMMMMMVSYLSVFVIFFPSYIYHSSFCDCFGLVPLFLFVFHQSIWFLI